MPTVREIEQRLFALAPRDGAIEWDNVGQLLGDPEQEISRVLVALDITEAVADEAIAQGCKLIVSHHPVMNCKWLPVQSVRSDTPQGHLLLKLLRNGVSAICMHTNLDVAKGGVNDCLAEALELIDPGPLGDPEGLCRMGTLPAPMPLAEFAAFVCRALGANGVRYAGANRPVQRVAVGGGACGEYEAAAMAAGCDTFVTSDLSYHQFLDAEGKGINLIDAGHFPTEDPVCARLITHLTEQFPELSVTKSASHREVIQYYVKGV
ncbi:dinuclear metal center protein, YbgI/SA1388 family [Oscillibacter sp. PC13]|uniref:Nif3-like dinuclear metal center hexameric protein n=1 Tax=Oscillibacter sp. PC13 TaxID=1855299 RepID=UPI0008E9A3AF|nr:Nif3-like dinuclear metal center hexameric protein [Oscillibacter sp. PC13]SFP14483.1 dinuclear metal center protein, YbgI/SA1388 family [Oscillibacter sp. PC13]